MTPEVTIYCQHRNHSDRRATICTLRQVLGGWDEAPATTHLKMASGDSGERSIPAPCFEIMDPGTSGGYLKWLFHCPIDRRHNVQVRQSKLNPVLDVLAGAGVSEVSLQGLAARV